MIKWLDCLPTFVQEITAPKLCYTNGRKNGDVLLSHSSICPLDTLQRTRGSLNVIPKQFRTSDIFFFVSFRQFIKGNGKLHSPNCF